MGSLIDDGGGALTAIVLAVLGAVLLLGAVGAFLTWRRSEDPPAGATGRHARLVVSEAAIVDGRRRLVLVRRDNVEHLLLIGGPSDIVVESNIVRQRAAGLPAGPRPAMARQSQPQAARPAAAAGFASAAPEPRRPGEADRAAQERPPTASPPEPRRSAESETAAQERLRSASTALALRQAVAQPGPAGQAAAKGENTEAPSQASTAVAGLAAGLAALTAAAGSRSRTEVPEGDKDAKRAGPVADTTGNGDRPAPEEPDETAPTSRPAEAGEADELGRAVFGLRDAPQVSGPAEGAPERPAADTAARQPPEETAGDRSGTDESAILSRRSVEADFAFLDGDDEDRSGTAPRPGQAHAVPVGQVESSAETDAERSDPAELRADAAGTQSSSSDQDEPGPAATPTAESVVKEAPAALEQNSTSESRQSSTAAIEPDERERRSDQALPQPAEPASMAEPCAVQEDSGSAGVDSLPAAMERSEPAEAEGPQIESPALRAGGEHPLPVPPVASTVEQTIGNKEPAKASDSDSAVGSEQTRPQMPPAHGGDEQSGFDVLPVSAGAPRLDGAAAPLSGFRPGRGTTLGDLAERLEEVLIKQAASDPKSDAGAGIAVGAAAISPSPAPPQRDEPARAGPPGRDAPEPQPGQRPPAAVADKDEAAIIDFAARRKSSGDSLEEEMARLLGELTRDTSRR